MATGAIFQVPDPATTFTLNAIINNTSGFGKDGAGTMVLNQPYFDSGTGTGVVSINGGTLKLGADLGANALFTKPTATAPTGVNLNLSNGTLDLNGNNQLIGALATGNPLPFAGGTAASPNSVLTNSATKNVTLTINGTNAAVSTVFSGNLNLDKAGNNTLTLTSPQTYTGTTTVRGGILSLRDSGSLASTQPISIFHGTLDLNNQGLSESASRIGANVPLNLTGGAVRVLSTASSGQSENLGPVALLSGMNELNITPFNSNGNTTSYALNIAGLTQTPDANLNFVAATNGSLGDFSERQSALLSEPAQRPAVQREQHGEWHHCAVDDRQSERLGDLFERRRHHHPQRERHAELLRQHPRGRHALDNIAIAGRLPTSRGARSTRSRCGPRRRRRRSAWPAGRTSWSWAPAVSSSTPTRRSRSRAARSPRGR